MVTAPFTVVEQWIGVPIHTGQWLSVLPVLAGIFLISRALRLQVPPRHATPVAGD